MKLKEFNEDNTESVSPGKPTINVHIRGRINISKAAMSLMQLKINDRVSFFQDEENPHDWYLCANTSNGLQLKARSAKAKDNVSCNINNSVLAKTILKSLKVVDEAVTITLSDEPQIIKAEKYFALLTAKVINRKEAEKQKEKPYTFNR